MSMEEAILIASSPTGSTTASLQYAQERIRAELKKNATRLASEISETLKLLECACMTELTRRKTLREIDEQEHYKDKQAQLEAVAL